MRNHPYPFHQSTYRFTPHYEQRTIKKTKWAKPVARRPSLIESSFFSIEARMPFIAALLWTACVFVASRS